MRKQAVVALGFIPTRDAAEAMREFEAFDPDGVVLDVDLGAGPTGIS